MNRVIDFLIKHHIFRNILHGITVFISVGIIGAILTGLFDFKLIYSYERVHDFWLMFAIKGLTIFIALVIGVALFSINKNFKHLFLRTYGIGTIIPHYLFLYIYIVIWIFLFVWLHIPNNTGILF